MALDSPADERHIQCLVCAHHCSVLYVIILFLKKITALGNNCFRYFLPGETGRKCCLFWLGEGYLNGSQSL